MKLLAVITSCKRPHNIDAIRISLEAQTNPPDEIWVFYNGDKPLDIEKSKYGNIITSNRSDFPLTRFSTALASDAEYLYIIDDDCVPGRKFIESCWKEMEKHPGIFGPCGVVLKGTSEMNVTYHGLKLWTNPPQYTNLNETHIIDFPLNSYFIKRTWLNHMFEYPMANDISVRGAEIRMAARAWISDKIQCYCPAQPTLEHRGLTGDFSHHLTDALHKDRNFITERKKIILHEMSLGWNPIYKRLNYV
jgi:hypothetical protein